VEVILGLNGYIWVAEAQQMDSRTEMIDQDIDMNDGDESSMAPPTSKPLSVVGASSRERIARLRNSILALSEMFLWIYPDTIAETVESSIELKIAPKDILKPEIIDQVTQRSKMRCQNQ
jgi:hypothetical protein